MAGLDLPGKRRSARLFCRQKFVPRQNPFYIALPYNDVSGGKNQTGGCSNHSVVLKATFVRSGQTVLKGRWLAVRKRIPDLFMPSGKMWARFRLIIGSTFFGNDRPRANLNRGAGLDVFAGRTRLSASGTNRYDRLEIS